MDFFLCKIIIAYCASLVELRDDYGMDEWVKKEDERRKEKSFLVFFSLMICLLV